MSVKSEHKPVITEIEIKWPFAKPTNSPKKINFDMLHDQNRRREYHLAVTNNLENQPEIKTNQDRWTNIMNATKQDAVETLGFVDKKIKVSKPSNNKAKTTTYRYELNEHSRKARSV